MKDENFYPELTEAGKQQAQELMNDFEKRLKSFAEQTMKEVTTDFYCDVLHNIESDHWQNYRTQILNAICNYSNKKNGSYDFARIRKAIFKEHKEEIIKDLNQDLVEEIEMLKRQLSESRSLRF